MSSAYFENEIKTLLLSDDIVSKLSLNNICKISDLWKLKRRQLKDLGFSDNEINQIIIRMQLNGIDLNKKIY